MARWAHLSLLALASLLVFIPFDKAKLKAPILPEKKRFLGALGFLGFLGALGGPHPYLASLAFLVFLSFGAIDTRGTGETT